MRSLDERQAELDSLLEDLNDSFNRIIDILYQNREDPVRIAPDVAFTLGMLMGCMRQEKHEQA